MIEIITEADYKDRLAATQNGVLLFCKKLCPQCKNMEKVLELSLIHIWGTPSPSSPFLPILSSCGFRR